MSCRRCAAPTRSVAEVAAEMRTWVPECRAQHMLAEERYSIQYPTTAPPAREVRDGADRFVSYCADIHLPAMALELDGGLCWSCAYLAARDFLHLRRLVFEGLLAACRSSGRDERAEEEFELLRCAA